MHAEDFAAMDFAVQFRYTRFLYSFRNVASGLRRPSPLACAVGYDVDFAVNATLMASLQILNTLFVLRPRHAQKWRSLLLRKRYEIFCA